MIEFARPEMLWALPLAALPLLIHLLSRRRYRRVRWAAMEYLLAAEQRRRGRLRVKNLLLLVLRTLAVLLLVLLFARPRLGLGLPGVRGAEAGRLVVVLDRSASMSQSVGRATVFERAKKCVRAIAERAAGARLEVRALPLPHRLGAEGPILPAAEVDPRTLERLNAVLSGLQPAASRFPVAGLVASAGDRAEKAPGRVSFHVVSDLRAADWGGPRLRPAARRALQSLQRYGPVHVYDVGRDPGPNAALTGFRGTGRFAYAEGAATFRLGVRNGGPDPLPERSVEVALDGSGLPRPAAPQVAPGQSVRVPVGVHFGSPGFHRVEAGLETADGFPPDDRRFLVVRAHGRVPVLLVEGSPRSASFLEKALSPAETGGGIEPHRVQAGASPPARLERYAAVFLCNLPAPGPWAQALKRYVRGGGRLAVFLGPRTGRQAWNDSGLLPCKVGDAVRPGPDAEHFGDADFAHPLLAPFEQWGPVLRAPRFYSFHRLESAGDSAVPIRFAGSGTPALVVRREGKGLTAAFPFGAADRWTDWPRSAAGRVSYLSLMQWLVEWGPAVDPRFNLRAGERAVYPSDAERYRASARLRLPSAQAGGREPVHLEARPVEGRDGLWFRSPPLHRAGVWTLQLTPAGDGTEEVLFAVNVPEEETDLRRADHEALRRAARERGRLTVTRFRGAVPERAAGTAGAWRTLAWLLLVLLVVESGLAYLFGVRPTAGAEGGSP